MIGDNRGILDDVEEFCHYSLCGIDTEMISHDFALLPPSQMVLLWGGMRRCFKLEGLQILTIIQRLKGQSRVRCSKQDLFYASRFQMTFTENKESTWFYLCFRYSTNKKDRNTTLRPFGQKRTPTTSKSTLTIYMKSLYSSPDKQN